jgi:hypothetical protein
MCADKVWRPPRWHAQRQGSKVAMCEKYLMMQACVAYIVRTGRLSSRVTVVRTDGTIVFPGRDNSLSGSAESEYCRRDILMIEPLVSRPLRAVLPVLGVGIFACGWREVLVRPNVLHVGCAWRCRSSLSGCYLPVPLAGVPMQRGEADWRPVLQPLRRLQQR